MNPPDTQDWIARVVAALEDGLRLDVFVARQPELASRTLARSLIEEGLVRVDGSPSRPGSSLSEGQVVEFRPRPSNQYGAGVALPSLAEAGVRVLHEDAFVLVIEKPPGISCHPPEHKRDKGPTIAGLALAHCGQLPVLAGEDRPGIVHRLDKDTSGVMVLAKTDEAFHFLQSQFKARSVSKEYRAICFGESRFDSDHIQRNISHHPNAPDRMIVVPEGGREATTYFEVVERFVGFTHFRCEPKTGRTHQIRVHMMSVGHSLVGDRVYRSRNHASAALPSGAPEPQRQCLHAHRLRFLHPRTHERLEFDAPIPEDMECVLRWLRQYRSDTARL